MSETTQEHPEGASARRSPRKLVVGLGNPGSKYERTRHNYGFWVIDELARRFGAEAEEVCRSRVFAGNRLDTEGVESAFDLAQPLTYMNRSGLAVRCLAQRFGYDPEHILVVYDEVALPLGTQRLRGRGSPAGHRGLESVLENLRTDEVPRLRLGIAGAEARTELADFVLSPFDSSELELVENCIQWAADACESWLGQGLQNTMNRFNGAFQEPSD